MVSPALKWPFEVALDLSPLGFSADITRRLVEAGVVDAVRLRDNAPIFDWVMTLLAFQGISDRAAVTFQAEHGRITWDDVQRGLEGALCPRLRSWWHFRCGYRKTSQSCAELSFIPCCALPRHDIRKGVLAEAAYGFALFIRDVCSNDFVGWIDERLGVADQHHGSPVRGLLLGKAVLDPLVEIPGTGRKVWSLVLADLLLGADPSLDRWVTAGASMIVVDTLTHNFLHRTGTLRQRDAEHAYGPRCYQPGGCADVIMRIAQEIDASAYDPGLPAICPRFVQHALWYFCAESGWAICNGRQIDDRYPCRQAFCPAGLKCARLPSPRWFDTERY